jgi:hypothetical protein
LVVGADGIGRRRSRLGDLVAFSSLWRRICRKIASLVVGADGIGRRRSRLGDLVAFSSL